MPSLNLARFLLVAFLHRAYFFPSSLLILGLLLLLELAACFLDGLSTSTGVDLAATADAEALVY